MGCVSGSLITSSGGQVDLDGYSIKQQSWKPQVPRSWLRWLSCFFHVTPSQQGHKPLLALGAESFQFH